MLSGRRVPPPEERVVGWLDELSNWGRWGEQDMLGTLNLVTPAVRRAASAEVRDGVVVSCSWDIDTQVRPDQVAGSPQRFMLSTGEGLADPDRVPPPGDEGLQRLAGASEYLGLAHHGNTVTHIDALSHVFWDGRMYGGRPAAAVTAARGATQLGMATLPAGIMTRGVLLDVAALWGREWLEPGEAVYPEDLEASERRQGVRVAEGDALLLHTGDAQRKRARGLEDVERVGRAGYQAACLPWLRERGVAVLGCDTPNGVRPSGYASMVDPIHVVGIVAMGLWLVDNCRLEELAAACRQLSRWTFQFTVAPLRWVGATGSPVNPLAVF